MMAAPGTRSGSVLRRPMEFAGFAGILSFALGLAGVIVSRMWGFPGTGATAGEIAGFVDAHRSALLVDMVLTTAAVWLWLVFGAGVWLRLREGAGSGSFLPTSFLAGLVGFVTLLFAGFACFFVLVYRTPEASDPRLLYDLSFGLLAMSGAPTALALASYAALVLRSGCLPRWTAWLGVVAALAHIVALGLVSDHEWFLLPRGRSDHRDPRHPVRLDRRHEHRDDGRRQTEAQVHAPA